MEKNYHSFSRYIIRVKFKHSLIMTKFYYSVLAGIAIGIAAICNLKSGGIIGAALFAFALSGIVACKWTLFTGKAGFFSNRRELADLLLILFYNAIGVGLAVLLSDTLGVLAENATKIVELRKAAGMRVILPSILTGLIMTVSVKCAREGQWIPLILGIPTFVMCGFPHCVADIAYYIVALDFPWEIWLMSVVGNFIGCNLPTLLRLAKSQVADK